MKLLVRKKVCLFFLLVTIIPTVHGMKRSQSCSDMKPLKQSQQQQLKSRNGNVKNGNLQDGQYIVVNFDSNAKPTSSEKIKNPLVMPPKAVRVCHDSEYKGSEPILVPKLLPQPVPFKQKLVNVFNEAFDSQLIVNYIKEKINSEIIFPVVISFLSNGNMEKTKLKKQLALEEEEIEMIKKNLAEQKKSYENDLRYLKKLSSLQLSQ